LLDALALWTLKTICFTGLTILGRDVGSMDTGTGVNRGDRAAMDVGIAAADDILRLAVGIPSDVSNKVSHHLKILVCQGPVLRACAASYSLFAISGFETQSRMFDVWGKLDEAQHEAAVLLDVQAETEVVDAELQLVRAGQDAEASKQSFSWWREWILQDGVAKRYPAFDALLRNHEEAAEAARDRATEASRDLAEAQKEMGSITGLQAVKEEIIELTNMLEIQRARQEQGLPASEMSHHLAFLGPPGTGKTTVARLVGRMYRGLGILNGGHVVEVSRQDLVAGFVGQSAMKTNEVIDRALDGILFIDEAYSLTPSGSAGNDYGHEVVETLLKRMEDDRGRLVVIVAGYEDEMRHFLASNPGLDSRFGRRISFPNYSNEELVSIVSGFCRSSDFDVAPSARPKIAAVIAASPKGKTFGNARAARSYVERAVVAQANRLIAMAQRDPTALRCLKAEDFPDTFVEGDGSLAPALSWNQGELEAAEKDLAAVLQELEAITGLRNVKGEITTLTNVLRVQRARRDRGLPISQMSYHLAFLGPPGTGKTTVARLVGRIYKALGILRRGHVIEVARQDLVAEFVGQTAVKTNETIDGALDGILFIDEAYSLAPATSGASDFGTEAVEVLLKRMEDDRSRLVVIVAGYEEEMQRFFRSNPGLDSRFTRQIEFPSYSDEELAAIVLSFCAENQYNVSNEARGKIARVVASCERDRTFGNARTARTYVERAVARQANRIVAAAQFTSYELGRLEAEDFPEEFVHHV
jgi:SpoVK/Ycf46/Vps4 family AAA+-type ATPase